MKQTTEAIVLGLKKHSDKMSLLQVYTKAEGRLALQVYGAHGKHKIKAAYQPLSIVELTYSANPSKPFATVDTIDPVFLPEQVYADIRRQSIALFVTEMLMLTLTHPQQDEPIYEFLDDFVHELNGNPTPENLHINFMMQFAELLGIGSPEISSQQSAISNQQSAISNQQSAISDQQSAVSNRRTRQEILRQLCNYYLEHVDSFRLPKSLDILIEVFD